MSAVLHRLRKDEYRDSGTLMRLAQRLKEQPGVLRTACLMATPRNVEMLGALKLVPEDVLSSIVASPSDLLLVVEAESGESAEAALARIDELLVARTTRGGAGGSEAVRSLDAALERAPAANLAVVSVPGPVAARETRRALEKGLHVFLFSNGVPLESEIELKALARSKGLLVMGPDCGTAILDGVPIGFANRVRRGPVGIVGASGTGIQETSTLLHKLGTGVSHAIGTGGRDLSLDVGAGTALQAIELLARDPGTRVLLLVSKPPAPAVAEKVLSAAARTGKPVVACLLGGKSGLSIEGVTIASTLAGAVNAVGKILGLGGIDDALGSAPPGDGIPSGSLRGLFSGGSLAYEALSILSPALPIRSNLGKAGDPGAPHEILDLGEDEYTRGRPHPMIDPTIRVEAIREAGRDPSCSVLLLDVVLGCGSHPDPAGALAPALREARESASLRGGRLDVVASVTGTELDPQDLARQTATLRAAGVRVLSSNAAAARAVLSMFGKEA